MLASMLPLPMEFIAVNNNEVFIRPARGYKFVSYYEAVTYVTFGAAERQPLVDLLCATGRSYSPTRNTSCKRKVGEMVVVNYCGMLKPES